MSSDPKILQTGSEDHDQTANANDHLPSMSPYALGHIFAWHRLIILSGLVMSGFPLKLHSTEHKDPI